VVGGLLAAGTWLSENTAQAQYNPYGFQTPYVPPAYTPSIPSQGPGYGGGGSPYGGYNPYGYNPYDPYGYSVGSALYGAAEFNRSYGQVANAFEKARLLREQWNQMQLDTKKKKFDLDMYIKANTLTYTEEQARVARLTLKRIQSFSLPGEISTGKALNYLLDDIRKYPNKKLHMEPIMLTEAILNQINVTKNNYGIGILRDGGKFTWPAALHEMIKPAKRADFEARIQALVRDAHREATGGRIDTNKLKDIRDELDAIRAQLINKVHEIPSTPYMDAKRFLQEFYEATVALERGDAPVQTRFQQFVAGGKSIQEVVDYMITNGLRFAAATSSDEASYRAVHGALAAYDIAMNAQVAMAAPKE
jgi:hypothetical protein